MPRDLGLADARMSVGLNLEAALSSFDGGAPLLDPIEHMGIDDGPTLALVDRIEQAELELGQELGPGWVVVGHRT